MQALLLVGLFMATAPHAAASANSDNAPITDEPTTRAHVDRARQYVGTPFVVEYFFTWEGDADAYVALPLTPPEIDWGNVRPGVLHTEHDAGQGVLRQELHVTPHEEGSFRIPALRQHYLSGAAAPEAGKIDRTLLSAEAYTLPYEAVEVEVVSPVSAWVIALPIFVVLLLALCFVLLLWWRRRDPEIVLEGSPHQQARALFHQAQRLKLDGDWYAMYQTLAQIVEQADAGAEDTSLLKRLRDATKAVGYQGKRPTEDELSGDLREVERIIARLKEDTRE